SILEVICPTLREISRTVSECALYIVNFILVTACSAFFQAANPGKIVDPSITKYSAKVLPFNYDQSVYGFREYFKKYGFKYSEAN
uniref:Uncharacterized protein n=1 Tax=Aegilops tauschii subsp. strangulata TaxID=200361 RepID=A0A452ZTP1_AEGTS